MDIPLREFNNDNWEGDDFECILTNDDSYYGTSLYYVHNNIPDPNKETMFSKAFNTKKHMEKINQCDLCCVIL